MPRLLILITALAISIVALLTPSRAADNADQQAMQAVITGQLQAFATGRDDEAYGYAAPLVRFAFPTVDSFMAMVKKGYQPVHRNNGYSFAESATDTTGRPTQTVIIKGTDGKTYEARYTLEQQPDGTWKIAGCIIRTLPGQEV
jgi:hypothetical protein